MTTLICNIAFAACDAVALRLLAKKRTLSPMLTVIVAWGLSLLVISATFWGDRFYFARLAAYAIFLHAPIFCLGLGAFTFRVNRFASIAALTAVPIILAVAYYAFYVEPIRLEVVRHEIRSPKIRQALRVVVVADLQTSDFGPFEETALRTAVSENPDLLLFAGDYVQSPIDSYPKQYERIRRFLSELKISPRLGAFAVQGNCETPFWPDAFRDTGVLPIESFKTIKLDDLNLTCLSLAESFYTALNVPSPDPKRFHLILGHGPHYAWGEINADLLLSGHTHGGQVRIPFIGPLTANAPIPMSWASGMTKLKNGADLIVSRGIGMERGNAPPIRFNCLPEITVIDLVPE